MEHFKRSFLKVGGNNAEASGSASRQVQQAELAVGQDGSGGSGVGHVIGLSVADCASGAGVGVGSQASSQAPVTKTRNADGREMGHGIPTHQVQQVINHCNDSKRIQKTKATSYKAKLMTLEDDMGWYSNE
ncbi:hypothetical protein Tco_0470715 [Tanacetum coccineum]